MKLFRNILLSSLLLFSSVGYSQNNLISDGTNLIKVGNSLLYWAYDVDAKVFFDTIEARGGSLTGNEKDAINSYVKAAKGTNGWWDDALADYPMVGGAATSCAVNLKNPGTFDLTFVNTVSGDFTSNGWTPNGSTSYGNTGIVYPGSNNTFFEYYSRTNSNGNFEDIGVNHASSRQIALVCRNTTQRSFCYASTGLGALAGTVSNSLGSCSFSRVASNDYRLFRNGIEIASNTSTAGTVTGSLTVWIGASNENNSIRRPTNRENAGTLISTGLTVAQVLAQYNARQQMNTTLSREVN